MRTKLIFTGLVIFLSAACHTRQQTAGESSAANASPKSSVKASGTTPPRELTLPTTFYLITNRQVGPIQINAPVAELKNKIPPSLLNETSITREGRGYKAYEVRKQATDSEPALRVEESCEPDCRVWRIQVRDSAFKTPEGIGIGTTLGMVKKHYPISFLGPGETEIVAVAADRHLTFMLDVSKIPARQVPFLNLKNTPDTVRVLGLLVF